MGIKGIYNEIGPGKRVALINLAVSHFEKTNKPFRLAIDISIWQFQIQSGRGGTNPALRTLYYRLLRLLSLAIQPLFVFDGPNKPPFKRGKRMVPGGCSLPNYMTKQMLDLFGFPYHVAPGEAEAECAFLQREGVVDAVLSEDVDTLMFGCGLTIRNWSSEGKKNVPTHVSVYDAEVTKAGAAGLDRQGMILIALMSGGDYIQEGVPGCGIKVACEAARAGFGASLCKIAQGDVEGLKVWRENLAEELRTNENKFFRIKHKNLKLPEDFPNREVLGYYTHPVVSTKNKVERLKVELTWDKEVDIANLRLFVSEAFEWTGKGGATKFIRGLAPALLAWRLRARIDRRESGIGDLLLTAAEESTFVKSIHSRRTHFDTDAMPELRLVYQPLDIVPINMDEEPDDDEDYGRDGLAPVDEDGNVEAYEEGDIPPSSQISSSQRSTPTWDPAKLDKVWMPETFAKVGIPLMVQDWEELQRNPLPKPTKAKAKVPAKPKKVVKKADMPRGAIDKFFSVSKTNVAEVAKASSSGPVPPPARAFQLPPMFAEPVVEDVNLSPNVTQRKTRAARHKSAKSDIQSKAKLETKGVNNSLDEDQCIEIASSPPSIRKLDRSRTPELTYSSSLQTNLDVATNLDIPAENSPQQRVLHGRTPPLNLVDTEHDSPASNHKKVNRKLKFESSQQTVIKRSVSPDPDLPDLRTWMKPQFQWNIPEDTKASLPKPELCKGAVKTTSHIESVDILSSSPPLPKWPSVPSPPPNHITNSQHQSADSPVSVPNTIFDSSPSPSNKKNSKRFYMPRESLQGAWIDVDEDEKQERERRARYRGKSLKTWRRSEVEILDLTGD